MPTNEEEKPADIVVFGSFSETGGIQRRVANNINEWINRGLKVQIVSYRGGVCFYPEDIGHLVEFVDLGTTDKWVTLVALWRHLRRHPPKAILSTMHTANLVVARLDFLPSLPVRRVLSVPNSLGEARKKSKKALEKQKRSIRRMYPHADAVIAISSGVKRSLTETIGLRGVEIPCIFNGSVTNALFEKAREDIEHDWLRPERSHKVVLTAGRLDEQKDQGTLLRAVAALRRDQDVRVIIIGEGPLREELQHLAEHLSREGESPSEWFDLPGYQANPYSWMRAADCFVLCSRWEGFPNVLAEALAVGVPAVATDFPSGARDILADGAYGPIVPMQDPDALARAVEQVLNGNVPEYDPVEVTDSFTARVSAEKYLEVFGIVEGVQG